MLSIISYSATFRYIVYWFKLTKKTTLISLEWFLVQLIVSEFILKCPSLIGHLYFMLLTNAGPIFTTDGDTCEAK